MTYDPLERSGQIAIHGWLLIWSWGFLIPTGVLIWTHTKRHQPVYPFFHLVSGLLGAVLALAGFGYGVKNFSTFSRSNVSSFRKAHAYIGSIATGGMMIQLVLVAFFDKHEYGKTGDAGAVHRFVGWIFLLCGLTATLTGTYLASVTRPEYLDLGLDHENEKFAGGLIGAWLATALVTASVVTLHNKRFEQEVAPEQTKEEPGEDKNDIEGQQALVPPHQAFKGLEMDQN